MSDDKSNYIWIFTAHESVSQICETGIIIGIGAAWDMIRGPPYVSHRDDDTSAADNSPPYLVNHVINPRSRGEGGE